MNTQTEKRQTEWRRLLPFFLLALALVTALASLGTPWFSSGTVAPGTTVERSWTLWGLSTRLESWTGDGISTVSTFTGWESVSRAENARVVFQMALAFSLSGIVLSFLFGAGAGYLCGPGRRWAPLALGSIACLLLFLAPVVFAALLPGAFKADSTPPSGMQLSFWGSSAERGERSSWGPGAGWVLALVAFFLLFSSFLSWAAHELGWSFTAVRAALRSRAPAANFSSPPSSAAPSPSPPPQAPPPQPTVSTQLPAPVLSWDPESTVRPPEEGSGERASEAAHAGQVPASAGNVDGQETGRS
ncbi:MAG: hypothetical protein QXH42_00655 [Thermoplasmata archaeon]